MATTEEQDKLKEGGWISELPVELRCREEFLWPIRATRDAFIGSICE